MVIPLNIHANRNFPATTDIDCIEVTSQLICGLGLREPNQTTGSRKGAYVSIVIGGVGETTNTRTVLDGAHASKCAIGDDSLTTR